MYSPWRLVRYRMCSLRIECISPYRMCGVSLSYHTCESFMLKKQILHHHAHAHTQTRACARARTHTRACAPHTDPLQFSGNKMRRERPHAHKSYSVLLYYLSSINTTATHKYARVVRAHTHTHTHTSTHGTGILMKPSAIRL